MIILDTCTLIFDALTPERLTPLAQKNISQGEKKGMLYCCSISLWEVGMLIQKKRLHPGTDTTSFLNILLQARKLRVLEITVEIGTLATTDFFDHHLDPADRIIAATTKHYEASLITSDERLRKIKNFPVIW